MKCWARLLFVVLVTVMVLWREGLCSLPPCQKIDAAVRWSSSNRTHFFSGSEYILHNDYYNAEEEVFNVSTIVAGFPSDIDAAVNWFGRKFSYYFKGCFFYKLNEKKRRIRRRRMERLGLPCDVNAALNPDGRRILIFKGCQYWTLTRSNRRVHSVLTGNTSGLGIPCDLDAALTWSNGTSYVIKGDVVWPMTSYSQAAAPRSLDDWNLCSWRLCGSDLTNTTEMPLADDFPCNGDKRFCQLRFDQLTMAGSHNAGSGFDGDFGLLSCWVMNQQLSVLEQLRLGMRYLDIDPSWEHCGLLGTYHSFVCGGPICKMLKQIKQFLRENRHEVMAVNFNHEMRDHERVIPALLRQITSQLGNYVSNYYRYFGEWPSLRHAVSSNKRLIVIIDKRVTSLASSEYSRNLWVHSNTVLQSTWRGDVTVSYDCNQVVNSTRYWCQRRVQAPLLEIVMFGTSTSCLTTIADICLPLVHNLTRECQEPRHSHGRAPNILLVDFPERVTVPELSVTHASYMQNVRNVAVLSRSSCVLHVRAAVTWPHPVTAIGERMAWFSTGSHQLVYNWNTSLQKPRGFRLPLVTDDRWPRANDWYASADAAYKSIDNPDDVCFVIGCNVTCLPTASPLGLGLRQAVINVTTTSLGLPCPVQAAFSKEGILYFFQGCNFWQRDISGHVTGPYPMRNFGLPCDITAALDGPDGSIYFFKGENYWTLAGRDLSVPKSVSDWSADFLNC